ncbi:hypothetical protein QM480_03530 [Flectobacillus sp. DC10W]|uniref:Uncharacterized protein n=1 Tax=Flectobacillus longus TaxID=2984207 RepID=A0ABT6YIW3_9BACT|nr:hypothetical protein [Flectobacillus longus]MDI9863382.1 hypothetical protein [Flectobacillus longus]
MPQPPCERISLELRLLHNREDRNVFDCSEIAERLLETFPDGYILEFTPCIGRYIKGIEYGEKVQFTYHHVFVKKEYVYDPMFGSSPVLIEKFIEKYKSMNPQNIQQKILS